MKHHVVLADPGWSYKDKLKMSDGVQRSSDSQYDTMSVEQIASYLSDNHFNDLIAYDSLLFLWVTNPFVLDGSGARVCKAWGYTPKQLLTWVKGREVERQIIYRMGLGHYTRGVTEHVILAVKGEATWLIENKGVLNYFETDGGMAFIGSPGRHSEKPTESYDLIEQLARGPYMELFARKRRAGWTQFGNQLPPNPVEFTPEAVRKYGLNLATGWEPGSMKEMADRIDRDMVFCEHANENPNVCDCPATCACRSTMCKDKPCIP